MRFIVLAALVFATLAATPPKEEAVTLPINGGHLSGTLTIPAAKTPIPVALIIAGSGPTDRNGNSAYLHSDAYKKLAAALAERGIATLRYDKRGVGDSPVAQSEQQLRFDDYVNDALALTALLERDSRFSSVSIIGHSEGSLVGILAAERDSKIRAFVSLEGAGRNMGRIIDEQIRANPSVPANILEEVQSYDAQLLAGKTITNPDPLLASLFRPSVQPFLISEYRYDPAAEIAKISIPVLIVHGTHDIQISDVDAERLKQASPKSRYARIDNMNHVLVDAPADRDANIAAYNQPELPVDTPLVDALLSFLLAP